MTKLIEILKGRIIANSNWGTTATSFSPTIIYLLEDGRKVRIGYAERQMATRASDEMLVGIDDGSGSMPDYVERCFLE